MLLMQKVTKYTNIVPCKNINRFQQMRQYQKILTFWHDL